MVLSSLRKKVTALVQSLVRGLDRLPLHRVFQELHHLLLRTLLHLHDGHPVVGLPLQDALKIEISFSSRLTIYSL